MAKKSICEPVPEASPETSNEFDGLKYCIVRTYSAGVFAGYIESREGKEATILQARRLWYWRGAASLSQLAMSGTTKPQECKFPETMDRVIVTEVIEIIDCTETAKQSIAMVPLWRE
jgi:hypothetical protein